MKYPSLYLTGNIITADILDKLEAEQLPGQTPAAFGLEKGTRVRDEIGRAWADANDYWRIFQRKLAHVKEGNRFTTETRNQWLLPLLGLLGYEVEYSQPETVNNKVFDISHRDKKLAGYSLMLMSWFDHPDKKPDGLRLRMSPHALMQEYLNMTEHTYGLVSNGRVLRLLRDSGRISKLSYVEFDLERIFEENLYSDFALLYRLLHSSRMPKTPDACNESVIEAYHQLSLQEGGRIREALSTAVENAIKAFGNAVLHENPDSDLTEAIRTQKLSAGEYYQNLLRFIYRLLFLMVVEERRLVYGEKPNNKKQADIYYRYYSLQRLRNLVAQRHLVNEHKEDLWILLQQVFALYENNTQAQKLGLQALGSELFSAPAIKWLRHTRLSNKAFLNAFYHLCFFTDKETGSRHRVNYAALNTEEFGSVYEGLLDYEPEFQLSAQQVGFAFKTNTGGRAFQSHYTPEELVQPLIKHSLDYLLAERSAVVQQEIKTRKWQGSPYRQQREQLVQQHIYSLKVADVACGSGHILISAARRMAEVAAALIEEEEQPNPGAYRKAKREVIRHCIYGVDKNPLAVELCKVALWLEAHNPGEPLNFLDHHIKCGDAIVGLAHREELEKGIADEAFKAITPEEKNRNYISYDDKGNAKLSTVAAAFAAKNIRERKAREGNIKQVRAELEQTTGNTVQEAMAEYKSFSQLPETTPEEIERKAQAYKKFIDGRGISFLKAMADTQVAQFFILKTEENKDYLMTNADFWRILSGYQGWQDKRLAKGIAVASEQRFFHWFLEFPEVFEQNKGFDCVLGNPPYLGGKRISGNYGHDYINYLKTYYAPSEGSVDLISYFVRRYGVIIQINSFAIFISTNSISQGDTRVASLDELGNNNCSIIFANKNIKWPGLAAVDVSLVGFYKGDWKGAKFLNGIKTKNISTLLDDDLLEFKPHNLFNNQCKSFQGSIILGDGFIVSNEEGEKIIALDNIYTDVIFPYLIGDNINSSPEQKNSRSVINFFDWDVHLCKEKYPICFEKVETFVKPERELLKDKGYREKWWQYGRRGVDLYKAISNYSRVLVVPQTTKYLGFSFIPNGQVISGTCIVFSMENYHEFSILHSFSHEAWVWKFPTTMGSSTLRYVNSQCFETFPFPQHSSKEQEEHLQQLGEAYHEHRRLLMLAMQLGLTKTYNAFHAREVQPGITTAALQALDKKAIEKQYGKEVGNLWNHLQKTPGTCSLDEAITGIVKLRELHVQMDEAVLDAYGWNDIALRHNFYEVDYLPENDRVRYTIHPEARKEILKRLLELNHQIHAEEVAAGLWDKKKTNTKKKPKTYANPEEDANEVKEGKEQYGLGI